MELCLLGMCGSLGAILRAVGKQVTLGGRILRARENWVLRVTLLVYRRTVKTSVSGGYTRGYFGVAATSKGTVLVLSQGGS